MSVPSRSINKSDLQAGMKPAGRNHLFNRLFENAVVFNFSHYGVLHKYKTPIAIMTMRVSLIMLFK
jgi:hypothetical protein